MSSDQFKELPSVSEVLLKVSDDNKLHNSYITHIIKSELDVYRSKAKKGQLSLKRDQIQEKIVAEIEKLSTPSLKSVINGTGIVLHTGLGRAPVHPDMARRVADRMSGYLNLELDLETGKRGDRQNHLNRFLSSLAGSESGLMVNNNAAAVLLSLNTFAEGKEVIVSRGQQVEIGGSFRIPDVIRKSHCILKEVGTTNRTHLIDYELAITPNTALILWVHTSNYVVKGFTEDVSLSELVLLGKRKKIPVMADLGSGAMVDLAHKGIPREPLVSEIVNTGTDVVTFSGDKLMGGPQAGIIVGKSKWIKRIKANPIHRAVRCDKWSIALMEEALRTFENEGPSKDNLSLTLLATARSVLRRRADKILSFIPKQKQTELGISIVETEVEAGSGSLPTQKIESVALLFAPQNQSVSRLSRSFRTGATPVVGYTKGNCFHIDLKAILPGQLKSLAEAINGV